MAAREGFTTDEAREMGERVGIARPEQELGALGGIAQQLGDAVRHALDHRPSAAGPDHQKGDHRLQCERRADHAQADGLAVGREGDGNQDDGGDTRQPEQWVHETRPLPRANRRLPGDALFGIFRGFVQ